MYTPAVSRGMTATLVEYFNWIFNKYTQFVNYYSGYDESLLKPASISQLEYLISRRANKDHNRNGFNALHAAAIFPVEMEKRIPLLVLYGVDVNAQEQAEFGNTPLHILIANENTVGAMYLIDSARGQRVSIDFNLCDKHGCSPLLLASKLRQEETALHILDQKELYGAEVDLNRKDKEGRTALDYALILGQRQLALKLISLGAEAGVVAADCSNLQQFGESAIREILESVEVDPERDENAKLNRIHDWNRQTLFGMTTTGADIPASSSPIPLPSKKVKATQDLIEAFMDPASPLLDTKVLAYEHKFAWMSQEEKQFVLDQYRAFSGKSITEKCVREQSLLNKELRQRNNQASDTVVTTSDGEDKDILPKTITHQFGNFVADNEQKSEADQDPELIKTPTLDKELRKRPVKT